MTKAEQQKHRLELYDLQKAYKAEIHKLEESIQWHSARYESAHLRLTGAILERDAWRNASNYWEDGLRKQVQMQIENGQRRAQHDPNYAVIRELLHNNQDLDKVDLIELARNNPRASVAGMTLICEELGKRLKVDLKPKENKP